MSSLYKRATPGQRQILRIVEGAVLNEADAHGRPRNMKMARSIAKRAAGTLAANASVSPRLAAMAGRLGQKAPSEAQGVTINHRPPCEHCGHARSRNAARVVAATSGDRAGGERHSFSRRSPLDKAWDQIKRSMWDISRSGDDARIEAARDALRAIDRLRRLP